MAESPGQNRKTILVVDDLEMVLSTIVAILQSAGFCVIQAHSGAHALDVAREHQGTIDLLLSDVDMPGMSGPELGKALRLVRPELRVMLMSGFPDGKLLVLNYGWAFIEKPFVPVKLIEMVNAVLAAPDRSQSGSQYDVRKETGSE